LFIVRLIGVRIRVEGLENIPAGVCLFVANHTSAADAPAVVGSIPRRVSIMAKNRCFAFPCRPGLPRSRFVPVDRSDRESAIASVEKAIGYIRQGASFLIYPEGSRSDDGRAASVQEGRVCHGHQGGGSGCPRGLFGKRIL